MLRLWLLRLGRFLFSRLCVSRVPTLPARSARSGLPEPLCAHLASGSGGEALTAARAVRATAPWERRDCCRRSWFRSIFPRAAWRSGPPAWVGARWPSAVAASHDAR
ncbi:unnamed protein product [Prorocentrum cordatum]|uniref:Uncharacterized protein n=1 Tax=Prorocentrum cordatum TaxID=2364126 RepID=A0ABN9UKM8_9DINO|nr:unnamed protein product [Polarella glacialis]